MEQDSEKSGKSHGKIPVMVFIANQTPSFELTVKGLNHSFFGENVWWNYLIKFYLKHLRLNAFVPLRLLLDTTSVLIENNLE